MQVSEVGGFHAADYLQLQRPTGDRSAAEKEMGYAQRTVCIVCSPSLGYMALHTPI